MATRTRDRKYVQDMTHTSSVTAWAILHKGEDAGKLLANWSDNRAGSVCTAQVFLYDGPLQPRFLSTGKAIGKAGGGGYCKLSAAISDALIAGIPTLSEVERRAVHELSGRGADSCVAWFRSHGYEVVRVLG